ncbi:MAG: sugar ABC transporter permease [Defluviitaleaceae bacterium]|nr:sugar ABC transporter permease [Defluviitaleaceae bacterium]MCL2238470.1 sugar ABC transporter permease [Defluviitaleaceae bacterium]
MAKVVALMSAVIWGSGQVANKQYVKGLFFFLIQMLMVGIELGTGTLRLILGQVPPHPRHAGMFTEGIWGIITLGTIPRETAAVRVFDHSTMLMLSGLLAISILVAFSVFYIWNIRDAYRTRKDMERGAHRDSVRTWIKKLMYDSFEYIAIAPGLAFVVLFSVIPILFAFLVAFTNYNMHNIPPRHLVEWVGFATFIEVINNPLWNQTLLRVGAWTVAWAFGATFFAFAVGFMQAILVNSKLVRYPKFWRGMFILPWAVPALVSQMLFRNFFVTHGVVNRILLDIGLINYPIVFFASAGWSRAVLLIVQTWLGFAWFMVMITGVMTTLNPEIYEAASIDGAGPWQQFKRLTLPTIFAAISPLLIMGVAGNFNNFGIVYFVTEGGPRNPAMFFAGDTDLLITWVYRLTLDNRMYNFASVMSTFIFIVIASVSVWNLRRTRAFKEE